MKKKYLALLLVCAMTVPFSLTSCGRLTDEIAQEDEDEDDEDEDDEDDEEDNGPVYVEVLDDSDVKKQLKVLVKNRDEWVGDESSSAPVDTFEYMVTDLDHNGRLEIIVNTIFDYGNNEIRLFEVDEDEKGLKEAKWKFKGIDVSSDTYPELETIVSSVRDKKKEVTTYQFSDYFDNGNNEYGISYIDLTYSDGKVTCYNYASMVMNSDYEWVFYTDDESEIDDMDEFLDFTDSYHDVLDLDWVDFGIYRESAYSDSGISDASDDDLKSLLNDSYRVFTGGMGYDEFDELYNTGSSGVAVEDYYEQLIGKWNLYSIDYGFETEYYEDSTGDGYITFVFYEDQTALFTLYIEGEIVYKSVFPVELEDDRFVVNVYDSDSEYFDGLGNLAFEFTELSDDGQDISVTTISYDEDGEVDEEFEVVFIRDKYYTGSAEDYLERLAGDWNIVSSELEGDVTYYEEGGDFYVTLSVGTDGTITMKESSNGRVFLEISEELKLNDGGQYFFDYSDPDALTDVVASETYTFTYLNDDGDELEVSIDFYDSDGSWLGYTILNFERA